MNRIEMDKTVAEIRELKRMGDEIAAQITALQEQLKEQMTADGVDVLAGTDWKASWKTITSERVDTVSLKKFFGDDLKPFIKISTTRRFTLS